MTPRRVTFAVDDVAPATRPLRECTLAESLEARLKEPMLGASHGPGARFVPPEDTHPLMAAVHLAFSQHHPLAPVQHLRWGLALR